MRSNVTGERQVQIGLAVSTVGRPSLAALLTSVAQSTMPPSAVAIADHTPHGDLRVEGEYPFRVVVVPSSGGAGRGQNDAVAALSRCDVVGFPNDNNLYVPNTLEQVAVSFGGPNPPAAVAGTLLQAGVPHTRMPRDARALNRRTVWKAVEPAMFIQTEVFARLGGLRDDLGTGAASPWQSGGGTDLLLRLMAGGGTVESRPGIVVLGRDEKKGLPPDAMVAKHRAYGRGTGFVYRTHHYPASARVRLLVAPLLKAATHDPDLRLSFRIALARTTGRWEGLAGRPLPGTRELSWM
jgi:hypothetical protein